MMSTAVPPERMAPIPLNYPGPAGIAQLQQGAQAIDTQFKQAIQQSTAETARMEAKTRQQTEQRQAGELTYLPDASGGFTGYPKYNPPSATGTPTGLPTGPPTPSSPTGSPTSIPIGTTLPTCCFTGIEFFLAPRLPPAVTHGTPVSAPRKGGASFRPGDDAPLGG